jgi:hypothetical protein
MLYAADPRRALAEIARVTAPSGRAIGFIVEHHHMRAAVARSFKVSRKRSARAVPGSARLLLRFGAPAPDRARAGSGAPRCPGAPHQRSPRRPVGVAYAICGLQVAPLPC